MYQDQVRQVADHVVKLVAKRGRRIARYEAKAAAAARIYLHRCGVRAPTTSEQARALDPRARDALRVFYGALSNWVEGQELDRCQQMMSMLASAPPDAPVSTRSTLRPAPGPICGWWPVGPRGICTKRDWRQKAAA